MSNALSVLEKIDAARLRRVKELSEVKTKMAQASEYSIYGVHSKALIVLTYSHWEGFYNECARFYISFLKSSSVKVSEVSWGMLLGVLTPSLQSLRDRNYSIEAGGRFVDGLKSAIESGFDCFDESVVLSRSNLNFQKLRQNYDLLGFDLSPFQRFRIRIDKELVGWRHSIAHGDDPDLHTLDLENHIKLTQELLFLISNSFQENIYSLTIPEQRVS
ncbi:MAE_28990/MAE_18760 family HEPN-like nuclease [Salinicola lusitanus]|uniref:MAE_28990/MAE_18760 family HEPN-like nuclease n=1 Tax=Salinicola lusitanus TaxID=1949085 RepID=UPI000DA23ECE|nr:MAE_28990/MAE_18760 family HEPN-like nuclease [Salinicola lusitanus]